jgi:hypothetical protein
MSLSRKQKIVVGGVAALAIVGGGGAIAATQLTPSERSTAIINDAAGQLGVQPSALANALKKAEENQIDAAVAAGQITQDQADKLKAAIESGQAPVIGGLGGFGFGHHGFGFGHDGPGAFGGPGGALDAAATYLGVSTDTLKSDLASGKSLADVANAQGKSVDGLVTAITDPQKKQIDAAVTAGKLTEAQATQIESNLEQRVTNLVNGTLPARPYGGGFGFRHPGGPDDDGGFGGRGFGGGAPGGGSPGGGSGTFGGTTTA